MNARLQACSCVPDAYAADEGEGRQIAARRTGWYTSTVPKMLLLGTVMNLHTRISRVKSPQRRSTPSTVNGTVPPRRVENAKRRTREYPTVKEVGSLLEGARERGRYGHRDATMFILLLCAIAARAVYQPD